MKVEDRLVAYLTRAVPTLPDTILDLSEAEIAALAHSVRQNLIAAAQALAPHLSREAFQAGFSGAELRDWLGPEMREDRTTRTERLPRGSYTTANVTLRSLNDRDIDLLYQAAIEPRLAHRWRFRGRTPSPSEFYESMFDPAVLAQHMVVTLDPEGPVGVVIGYDVDRVAGHCRVALQRVLPQHAAPGSEGLMIEGFFAFVQYLFDHFDLRKVYVEVPEYNMSLFPSDAGSMLKEEGRLRGHYYFGDRLWDCFFLALYREQWEEVAALFRGRWPEGHFDAHPGTHD